MSMVKLSDITINLDNKRKPLSGEARDKISVEKKYPYCGANNIIAFVDEYLFDEEILCIAEDGGKWGLDETCSYIMNEKCWVNNHAHVIKVIHKNSTDVRYLKYWLNHKDLNKLITGAIVKKLTQKSLNNIEIDMPSIDIQRTISDKLDYVQTLIDIRNQQISKLNELLKSQFVVMFENQNYPKINFINLCNKIGDGLHGTPRYSEEGKYPFINGNNFIDGKIAITESTKYVDEQEFDKLKINLSENTIFLSINGTLGKTAFYNNENIVLGKSACYFDLKENINKKYIYGVLNSALFINYIENSATKSTIKNVGLKALREFKVLIPPIELQNKYGSLFEKIDKQKAEIKKSIKKLEELKSALMQEYFG